MNDPKFQDFISNLETQRETRLQFVQVPLKQMDGVLEQEFMKGECTGISLATTLLPSLIETLTEDINQLIEENDDDRGTDD